MTWETYDYAKFSDIFQNVGNISLPISESTSQIQNQTPGS